MEWILFIVAVLALWWLWRHRREDDVGTFGARTADRMAEAVVNTLGSEPKNVWGGFLTEAEWNDHNRKFLLRQAVYDDLVIQSAAQHKGASGSNSRVTR